MRISDWSSDVCSSDLRLRQRLAELSSPARRLALLEAALQARLLSIRRIDPRIALALAGLRSNAPVSVVAERCDLSQRHFTRSFREAVGLAPKAWCRVHRFARALERLAAAPALFLADVAAAEGYADNSEEHQSELPSLMRNSDS